MQVLESLCNSWNLISTSARSCFTPMSQPLGSRALQQVLDHNEDEQPLAVSDDANTGAMESDGASDNMAQEYYCKSLLLKTTPN